MTQTQAPERFGIRLAVLGKTRSGKTTALYRLLSALIPLRWSKIIIFDGKRDTPRPIHTPPLHHIITLYGNYAILPL